MKKFLTVLLALSVVFTYTVGTAFAAGTTATAETPEAKALGMIVAKAETVKADPATANYEADAVTYGITQAISAGELYIKEAVGKNTTNGELNETAFYNDIASWCGNQFGSVFTEKATDKDFELKVGAAERFIETVDPAAYVEADQAKAKEYKTEALEALKAVKKENNKITNLWTEGNTKPIGEAWDTTLGYRDAINIYLYGATDAWAEIFTADDTMKTIQAAMKKSGSVKGLTVALDNLTTLIEDEENNEVTDAYIQNILANITYNAKADFYTAKKVDAGDTITGRLVNGKLYGVKPAKASKITAEEAKAINEALMSQINDTLEVLETKMVVVADVAGKTGLDAQVAYYKDHTTFETSMAKAVAAKEFYGKVVSKGEAMKDEVNFVGDALYNAADIDEAVADAKEAIYGYYDVNYDTVVENYFDDVKYTDDPVKVALNAAIDKWQDTIVPTGANKTADADKKYCKNYYSTKTAPVNWQNKYIEIRDEAIEALYDVKTVEEVEAIMADADAKLAELRTAENDNTKLANEIDKYKGALAEYATEQWKLVEKSDEYRQTSYNSGDNSALVAGEKMLESVATIDGLAAVYAEAKALFGNIKTDAELVAEAADVTKAIAKLPKAELAKEAEFTAVYDAYKAYLDNYGAVATDVTGGTLLIGDMNNLKALQIEAVEDAIAALDDDNVITRDELTAVEKMYDEYVAYYKQYGEAFSISTYAENALNVAKTTVWNNEVDAVKKLIAKLTSDSSLAEVKAAKDAYDALTGSQQRVIYLAFPYKVDMMESMLIKAVESLKVVKNHSVAGKGYIKIAWSVKGDATAADGYQIYRATKANGKYTKFFTTSKMTYKNTKSLKKGTKYFYKVRAYKTVDGVKYYSDWSNKAYRVAK